ncbi:MAG: ABC transporter substrate-binding protein [Deltaproteobacteria bacterium]|nr:ABC transporter substrate-binding protein [Deltaproteobacteria bacterium]
MMKVTNRYLCVWMLILLVPCMAYGLEGSDDLIASLAELPGLADSSEKGAFVEIVKAIDTVYTDGRITISVFPFARSVHNVIDKKADFHIPSIRNPDMDQTRLPYRIVTEKMGTVCFVIYSHREKPFTKQMLDDSIRKTQGGAPFPYSIEVPKGLEEQFPFPVISSNYVDQSLKKVAAKRIDALVWAQEETDLTLKRLKICTVRREFWQAFDDVILIPRGPAGDRLDIILSDALSKLRASGQLEQLYSNIHRPYDDWQPSEMGWGVPRF